MKRWIRRVIMVNVRNVAVPATDRQYVPHMDFWEPKPTRGGGFVQEGIYRIVDALQLTLQIQRQVHL